MNKATFRTIFTGTFHTIHKEFILYPAYISLGNNTILYLSLQFTNESITLTGLPPHEHRIHVAHFIVEVLKGPKLYSQEFGDDALQRIVGKHIGKKLKEEQRKRWVELLLESADEIGLPDDPEFRSTFVAHLEWGSRVALINSQLEENPTTEQEQIPEWGWGEVKGRYAVVGSLFQKKK